MRKFCQGPFLLGLLLVMPRLAPAQALVPYEKAFPGTPVELWQRPDVRADLKLSPQQVSKLDQAIRPIKERYQEGISKLTNLGVADAKQAYAKLRQETFDSALQAVEAALEAGQQKRLRQIALQLRGDAAFGDPEVQKALRLTPAQQKQIEALAQEYQRAMDRLLREARGVETPGQIPGTGPAPYFLRRQLSARTRAVLTDEQRRIWQDLIGEPFPARRR
jgi:hypothetical protein